MHRSRSVLGLVVAGLLLGGCTSGGDGADGAARGAGAGPGTAPTAATPAAATPAAATPAAGAPAAAAPTPAASSFREGTCRAAAPDVVSLPAAVGRLGRGPQVPEPALRELSTTQDRLRTYQEGAEPALRPALDQLVVAIGLARIRAVGNTYERGLGNGVSAAYERLLAVCTG